MTFLKSADNAARNTGLTNKSDVVDYQATVKCV